MESNGKRSLKRKANDQSIIIDEGGRVSKEAKRDTSCTGDSGSMLALRRLVPEDWSSLPVIIKEEEEEDDTLTKRRGRVVDRGTDWSGDNYQELQGLSSQLYVACNRSANRSSSFDCETQTYYFVENSQAGRDEASKDKGLVRNCCVIGCQYQYEEDSSISFYDLPSSKAERSAWADILGLNFAIGRADETQEICSKHFDASISPQDSLLKSAQAPKSRTRKKKTCDILIAEEAEIVKQSMATGRTKRTLKPNRNYDWAELIPLMKSEPHILEAETAVPKSFKNSVGPGRPRKQPLDDVKRNKKENERPYMEMRVDLGNEMEVPDFEEDEYEIGNISLPSAPRAPPPKPKGRPHRIQDTCTQTDHGLCSMKIPLREVKVQCNLTAEPLFSCSSCSSIDWRSLDEELFRLISVIEYEIVNPILSRCLSSALSQNIKPSHAANVLKMIAGLPRDVFESNKDIDIVPGEDELDEVEIEKFIHQEDAPIVGVKEITAKDWNKKVETVREVCSKSSKGVPDDQDSFGLEEATEKDEEEFKPDYSMLDEEEEDEELDNEDNDDDDDWDIKNEDDSGAPIQKKKKTRHKAKKEYALKAGMEQGSSCAGDKKEETLESSAGNKAKQQNRKRLRNEQDTRWIRQEHRCSECDIVFSTRRKYDLHYSHIHLGVAPWQGSHQCEDCGKVFTQKITLKVHRMFKHGAPRRFRCTKCTYVGPTKEYLKRHMKVHSNERQFVCRECGKGLKTTESYKNHMVLHTNEGRFFCETCQKAFNHKGAYYDHMHSHQEKRNFACYCGASFKVYKHVARHIRAVHLNDKRFICDICGTQHMTGFNLKNHLKKHSDMPYLPYSYQCTGCEAKFRGHQGLETHVRLVHNAKSPEDNVEEASDKQLINPHPTRRPTKYHFSSISEDVSNESVEENKKSQEGSIHVSCEGYILSDMKSGEQEEVVYNVSERGVDLNCDVSQDFIVTGNDEREVIHIYSCYTCNAIFASESLCQEHMTKAHS